MIIATPPGWVLLQLALALARSPDALPHVVYASGATDEGPVDLVADVYAPQGTECRGTAILVHGGSFISGSRDLQENRDYGHALASRGYLALAISYRLLEDSPVVNDWGRRYAAAIRESDDPGVRTRLEQLGVAWSRAAAAAAEDTVSALAWAHAHAPAYGCDAEDLAIFGASAGAISAMTVGYALDDYGAKAANPKAVIALRGRLLPPATGSSPFRAGDPPLLILHGDADERIRLDAADSMFRGATDAAVPGRFLVAPGFGHELGGARLLSLETVQGRSVLDVIDAFLVAAFGDPSHMEAGHMEAGQIEAGREILRP